VRAYAQSSGSTDEIVRIQENLSIESIARWNAQILKWQAAGVNIPKMGDWLEQSLKPDITKLTDITKKANQEVENLFKAISQPQ
jgi:uncharacterized protein (DUF608 family)